MPLFQRNTPTVQVTVPVPTPVQSQQPQPQTQTNGGQNLLVGGGDSKVFQQQPPKPRPQTSYILPFNP